MPIPPYTATEFIELRQYLLHSGQRDTLIELFDREFVETQERVGMDVLGQFRDAERPDYFVWLRAFLHLDARHESLTTFYNGPVWAQHRNAANATMIDSDNVMLLRAVTGGDAIRPMRRDLRDKQAPEGVVVIVAEHVERIDDQTIDAFRSSVVTVLEQSGCHTLGVYATEPTPNTFTRLPVRTDQSIVWFGSYLSDDAASVLNTIGAEHPGQERQVLIPTARSLLNGNTGSVAAA
jgi:hypothetical protein